MKRLINFSASLLFAFALLFGVSASAANLPSDWQHEQSFDVSTAGLVKISLPVETLDAARPALEDLRLYDDAGNEVPYLIERPVPVAKVVQAAKSFQVSLNANKTVITLETGLAQPLDGVTLETPAMNFIKAVRVESSDDGKSWQTLAQGQPIFRQPYGASQFANFLSADVFKMAAADRGRPAFATDSVHRRARPSRPPGEPAPGELIPVTITERDENPGETRLALNLGAANLSVASVQIETAEPLFMRQVSIAVPQISEDSIREQTIGQGVIYRVAVEGQTPSENLSVPLENLVRSRELICSHQKRRQPAAADFSRARRAASGLSRVSRAATGHFSFAHRQRSLRRAALRFGRAGHESEIRRGFADSNFAAVGQSGFSRAGSFARTRSDRRGARHFGMEIPQAVKISSAGAQQIELDLDVLAHAQPGFADLRVLRWQQPGALHHPAHVHQPRAHADHYGDE